MLEDIRIFVKVVQLSGFSNAARALQLPVSTVSRTIKRMEEERGTRLLTRSTRSVRPTDAGRRFYERCLGPVRDLEDAMEGLAEQDQQAAGLVRLTAPEDPGEHVVSPVLARLASLHTQLSVDLLYTDRVVDLISEGFDLAVRLGQLAPSRLSAKRIGTTTMIVVAAPAYLEGHPAPKTPEELTSRDCLSYYSGPLSRVWELQAGRRRAEVPIKSRIRGNQMSSLLAMALQGVGIALIPRYLCRDALKSGRLVHLLSDWTDGGRPVWLVTTEGKSKARRIQVLAEEIEKAVNKRLEA